MKQRINELLELLGEQDRNRGRVNALPFASYGDYDNSCAVERANHRWLSERLMGATGVTFETWSYGGRSVEVDVEALDDKAATVVLGYLEAVADYPAIDDELVSEVEDELISEYLGDCFDCELSWLREYSFTPDQKAFLADLVVSLTRGDYSDFAYIECGGSVAVDWDKVEKILLQYPPFIRLKQYHDEGRHDELTLIAG